jgi:hypothetical protein
MPPLWWRPLHSQSNTSLSLSPTLSPMNQCVYRARLARRRAAVLKQEKQRLREDAYTRKLQVPRPQPLLTMLLPLLLNPPAPCQFAWGWWCTCRGKEAAEAAAAAAAASSSSSSANSAAAAAGRGAPCCSPPKACTGEEAPWLWALLLLLLFSRRLA